MIVIVDYGAGNLRSVQRAFSFLGHKSVISSDPVEVLKAERVVFPGVGAAGTAMKELNRTGLGEAICKVIQEGVPVFGICLGLQIMLENSEENNQETLGIVEGRVHRFLLSEPHLKIPHMGWNLLSVKRAHPLLQDIAPTDAFYFVHSYYANPHNSDDLVATTNYEIEFCSVIANRNYFATQFHPEKSGRAGLSILSRFATWDGLC